MCELGFRDVTLGLDTPLDSDHKPILEILFSDKCYISPEMVIL